MDTKKKQFRLIGVRPLKGCATHIRKILKEETTYFLYDDYEVDQKYPEKVICKRNNNVPPYFFSDISNQDTPLISISAIVGKNGDGKSTIIELMIRILNNFAYAAGYQFYQDELNPIKGLKAILYYGIDDEVYYVEANGDSIKSNCFTDKLSIKNPRKVNQLLNKIEEVLFYTQIINYSLYAYNANEFEHENVKSGDCWINGIFHKNDAYQTPIVLNPWRENGAIDINKENYLMNQRLIALFVDCDNGKDSFRNIDNKKEAKYIIFNQHDESKLELNTYKDYFINTYKFEGNNFQSQINDAKEVEKSNEGNNYASFVNGHTDNLKNIKQIIEDNQNDFDFAFNVFKSISKKFKTKRSDFKDYLIQLKKTLVFVEKSDQNKKSLLSLVRFFTKNKYNELNLLQLQRIIIVITIRNLWHKKYQEYQEYQGYFSSDSTYGNDSISKSEQYIIYKTVSIITKYPQYRSVNSISTQDTFNSLFDYQSDYKEIEKTQQIAFDKLQNDINNERSHVTLKIRQTINYLDSLKKGDLQYIKQSDINKKIIESLTLSRNIYKDTPYIIDLTEYKKRVDNISGTNKFIQSTDTIDFLPPPIFETNILFQHIHSSNEYSYLSDFSSGERQLLNNVSSTIYHVRNINSVSNPDLIRYKYVNLVFEEIELYFHPDYQRKYIDFLLRSLRKVNLQNIASINMCFVTHSPFILSDIPNGNIMFLNNGKQVFEQMPTFGANIHDILKHSFFLEEGLIGEFAKSQINKVLCYLNNDCKKENSLQDSIYKIINLIGEPLIKERLLSLYSVNNISENIIDKDEEIKRLKDEIRKLKLDKLNETDFNR